MKLPRVYPIIDSAAWVERLAPSGVRLLQLRIKERPLAWVDAEIHQALSACRVHGIQLIVNDYWQLALDAPRAGGSRYCRSRSPATRHDAARDQHP